MRRRRKFAPEFKAKVVLELLRGDKTMAQLCREHEIGADLIGQWRKVVVERAAELFTEPRPPNAEAVRVAELERLVGQQAMELAVLKKLGRQNVLEKQVFQSVEKGSGVATEPTLDAVGLVTGLQGRPEVLPPRKVRWT